MNLLAHLCLSPTRLEHQLGNVLADVLRNHRDGLSDDVLAGIACHRRIDAFTDRHPAALASRARLTSIRRRYAGVAVDVLYDHFLTRSWERHGLGDRDALLETFYAEAAAWDGALPERVRGFLEWLVSSRTLGEYGATDGVADALRRASRLMTRRLGVEIDLTPALDDLARDYDALADDFDRFWPELAEHVRIGA